MLQCSWQNSLPVLATIPFEQGSNIPEQAAAYKQNHADDLPDSVVLSPEEAMQEAAKLNAEKAIRMAATAAGAEPQLGPPEEPQTRHQSSTDVNVEPQLVLGGSSQADRQRDSALPADPQLGVGQTIQAEPQAATAVATEPQLVADRGLEKNYQEATAASGKSQMNVHREPQPEPQVNPTAGQYDAAKHQMKASDVEAALKAAANERESIEQQLLGGVFKAAKPTSTAGPSRDLPSNQPQRQGWGFGELFAALNAPPLPAGVRGKPQVEARALQQKPKKRHKGRQRKGLKGNQATFDAAHGSNIKKTMV